MSKAVPIFPHGNTQNQKTIPCIAIPEKAIIAVIFGRKISDFPSTTQQT
jgi:hypothetical protein